MWCCPQRCLSLLSSTFPTWPIFSPSTFFLSFLLPLLVHLWWWPHNQLEGGWPCTDWHPCRAYYLLHHLQRELSAWQSTPTHHCNILPSHTCASTATYITCTFRQILISFKTNKNIYILISFNTNKNIYIYIYRNLLMTELHPVLSIIHQYFNVDWEGQ